MRKSGDADDFATSPALGSSGGGKKPKLNPAEGAFASSRFGCLRVLTIRTDALHCITRFNHPSGAPAAHVRGSRMPTLKPASAAQVRDALAEMGISQRLVMPTRANQEKLEALVVAVGNLVELKKQVDRIKYEADVATARANGGVLPGVEPSREASLSRAPTPAGSNAGNRVPLPLLALRRNADLASRRGLCPFRRSTRRVLVRRTRRVTRDRGSDCAALYTCCHLYLPCLE